MFDIINQRINEVMLQAMTAMMQNLAGKESKSTPVSGEFADLINSAAEKYGVDPSLVKSVIQAESNFNPDAISSAGAIGLMQLMPETARGLGVADPTDPEQNIDGGVRFLRDLLKRYDGQVELAVAAYNAGPGAVDRYGGIPPYQETQTYVKRVLGNLKQEVFQWEA